MFTFDLACFSLLDWAQQIPEGLRVQPITEALAQDIIQPLVGVTWPSLEDFLAEGLGFVVLDGDTIASTCFSVLVARGCAEISIDTHPDYRQRIRAWMGRRRRYSYYDRWYN